MCCRLNRDLLIEIPNQRVSISSCLRCPAIKNEVRSLGHAVWASEMRIGEYKTAVVGNSFYPRSGEQVWLGGMEGIEEIQRTPGKGM